MWYQIYKLKIGLHDHFYPVDLEIFGTNFSMPSASLFEEHQIIDDYVIDDLIVS